MNHFTTDLVQALVNKQDITEVFRTHLESAMNHLLETELSAFLDYEKYDRSGINSGNSRNGAYVRTLHTEYGDLKLSMPRDRNEEFKQQTVTPYKRSNGTLESFVIHMFQKWRNDDRDRRSNRKNVWTSLHPANRIQYDACHDRACGCLYE